jgi:hypothetical protein
MLGLALEGKILRASLMVDVDAVSLL